MKRACIKLNAYADEQNASSTALRGTLKIKFVWLKHYYFLLLILTIACKQSPGKRVIEQETDIQSTEISISEIPSEETEEEEAERLMREKYLEETRVYSELGLYNGDYQLYTESEGATGKLTLQYNGDKSFTFTLSLKVHGWCEGEVNGVAYMQHTQSASYNQGNCFIYFNFMGSHAMGKTIEIEQGLDCPMLQNDCSFTAVYVEHLNN